MCDMVILTVGMNHKHCYSTIFGTFIKVNNLLNQEHIHSQQNADSAGCGCMPGLVKLFSKKCACVPIYLCIYLQMFVCMHQCEQNH